MELSLAFVSLVAELALDPPHSLHVQASMPNRRLPSPRPVNCMVTGWFTSAGCPKASTSYPLKRKTVEPSHINQKFTDF